MSIVSFFKKNKFLSIIASLFIVWIAFLIVCTIIFSRTVLFYDVISQKDVSSDFSSRIPLLRYFVEPIYAIALNFGDPLDWIWNFVFFLVILRVLFYIMEKKGYFKSEKISVLMYPVRDFLESATIVLGLMILVNLAIIGLGFVFIGFHFVNNNFMLLIQVGITVSWVLILVKLGVIVVKLAHPHLKFGYREKIRKNGKQNGQTTLAKKRLKSAWREFSSVAGVGLIIMSFTLILVSTPFPTQRTITDLDDDEFLFDFHIHTTYSDGWLTPEERVHWYIDQGISGAAFSDHDNLRGAKAAKKYVEDNNLDFVVLYAEEWTDHNPKRDIHMNIYGLTETVVPLESKEQNGPKAMGPEDTIKYVKVHGGYVTVNHYNARENPNGGIGVPYTLEQFKDWGVDGFEVSNGGGVEDRQLVDFCLNHSLICIGGSDIHENPEIDTIVKLRLDNPRDMSVDNIFKNLRRNNHEVVAIWYYSQKIDLPDFLDEIGPFQRFFNYITNLEIWQLLSWMVWSSGSFTLIIGVYRIIKKLDLNRLKNKIL